MDTFGLTYQTGKFSPLHYNAQLLAPLNYPAAEATDEEVCADVYLFRATLDRLTTALGVKVKVPKVAGISVDLHLLYMQVTALGGLERVSSNKQWVNVCEPFNFPPSCTNKSFVMKKLYTNVLHHFEQVYFHRNLGPVIPPNTISGESTMFIGASPQFDKPKRKNINCDGSNDFFRPVQADRQEFQPADSGERGIHMDLGHQPAPPISIEFPVNICDSPQFDKPKRKNTNRDCTNDFFSPVQAGREEFLPAGSHLPPGTRFSGTVDSSFEHGFCLTLELPNSQQAQGNLYCRHRSQLSPQYMERAVVAGEQMCTASAPVAAAEHNGDRLQNHVLTQHRGAGGSDEGGLVSSGVAKRLKRHTTGRAPETPHSAMYFYACSIPPAEVLALHPADNLTEAIVRVAAAEWSQMSMREKQPFLDMASADLARYETESASLSLSVANGYGLRPNPRDSSASAWGLESHYNVPAHQRSGPAPKQLSSPERLSQRQHPITTALSAAHARAVAVAIATGSSPPPTPYMLGIPLARPDPQTTSLCALYTKAVAAAIRAGAPLPPPPEKMGFAFPPRDVPAIQHHMDELCMHDVAASGYDHKPYAPNHPASSESELCDQYAYLPEGCLPASSGPSAVAEIKDPKLDDRPELDSHP